MAPFVHHRQVQFHETDPAGFAHFAALLRYVEEAEHAWLAAAGWPLLQDDAAGGRLGWPRVAVHGAFHRPVGYGVELTIRLQVTRHGRRSVDYHAELFDVGDEAVATVDCTVVRARIGADGSIAAVDLPDDFITTMHQAGNRQSRPGDPHG